MTNDPMVKGKSLEQRAEEARENGIREEDLGDYLVLEEERESRLEQQVIDALKNSFITAINGLGGSVSKKEVIMPADDVWRRYAKVSIDTIRNEEKSYRKL